MQPSAIEIRALKKSYKTVTLGPLDLTVPSGAIYGFVGPNGAGKTTTIDLMMGMGAKDGGRITVFGVDHITNEVAMKQRVGYVSPDLDFRPWGRVSSAVHFVRGFYPTWDDAYCRRLLQAFDVGWDEKIAVLSFGARIKLALILALSWRPDLLVLDEPTVGLDAISKQQVFAELLAAVRNEDRTVFISSHAITDLERFADHVGMIKRGRLVLEGPVTEVLDRYRLVDLIARGDDDPGDHEGLVVQAKTGNRYRVLLDQTRLPADGLESIGFSPVADARLSLEELFVALGRD
jgi:ABC-2 type transport system ATP-binding protein